MATAAIAAPTTANEVLMLFSSALAKPADSQEQASVLEQVRSSIEAAPQWIPVLYSTILSVAPRAGRLLKRWIADVVELVVARLAITTNALTNEQRIHSGFKRTGGSARVSDRPVHSFHVALLAL